MTTGVSKLGRTRRTPGHLAPLAFDGDRQTFTILGSDGKPRRRPGDRNRQKRNEGKPGQVDFWADGGEFKNTPWGQEEAKGEMNLEICYISNPIFTRSTWGPMTSPAGPK